MTQNLKSLILKRQRAFAKYGGNFRIFKFFRNAVNRDRKVCKSRYYESRVQQMKGANPKGCWREVKILSGMHSYTRDLLSQLNVPEIELLSMHGKANAINAALFEPLDYAALLASPVCMRRNASFREQRLPTLWKRVEICPLPKKKSVENLQKDLRPIP